MLTENTEELIFDLAMINRLVDPYRYLALYHDGSASVLHTVLTACQVPHGVWCGQITHQERPEIVVAPHTWIGLRHPAKLIGNVLFTTPPDALIGGVDFCARMWGPVLEQALPDGVFQFQDWPDVRYFGSQMRVDLVDRDMFPIMTEGLPYPTFWEKRSNGAGARPSFEVEELSLHPSLQKILLQPYGAGYCIESWRPGDTNPWVYGKLEPQIDLAEAMLVADRFAREGLGVKSF
jgi:hypothetical protein